MITQKNDRPTIHHLRVQPFSETHIVQALPLAQALASALTLCVWKKYCEEMVSNTNPNIGMECAVDEAGYVLGLFSYVAKPDPLNGRVLMVDPFIAINLYGRDLAAQHMLVRAEVLAKTLNCSAIHIALEGAESTFPRRCGTSYTRILEHGYQADSVRLCKPL